MSNQVRLKAKSGLDNNGNTLINVSNPINPSDAATMSWVQSQLAAGSVTALTGTANEVIVSAATGAITISLPQAIGTTSAPTFVGTNFNSIPNAALVNSSVTVNGMVFALGSTGTVTAAAGTLTGTALNATVVSSALTSVGTIATGVWNGTPIGNAYLANTTITIGTTGIALGASSTVLAGLTSVTSTAFIGALTGAATTAGTVTTAAQPAITSVGTLSGLTVTAAIVGSVTGSSGSTTGNAATATLATTATNVAGGAAGSIAYQTAAGVTAMLATGSGVLVGGSTPIYTTTPSLVGTNFSAIPNSALTNYSITLGTTTAVLGSTTNTITGLTSVTSTTFVGALTGHASLDLPLTGGTMAGTITFSAGNVTGLSTPLNGSDAATKAYVDAAINGFSWKSSAACATTANITLSGEQTIDGILTSSSMVLVKNQTTLSQNGLYLSAAGAWTRALDAATGAEILGMAVYIQAGGTVNGGTGWTNSNTTAITLGTTSITFAQFGAGATYTNGTGIGLAGNVFSNTGVTSLVAGTNINISGATGAVTVSVTGAVASSVNLTGTIANSISFQSASGVTSYISPGTAGQVVISNGAGSAPTYSSAPTITGTNITSIPNAALLNSSVTVGTTAIALGASSTVLAGLTSVTSTTFVGALTGNANTATALAAGTTNSLPYQSSVGTTAFLAQGTGVLQEIAGAPAWTTTPTIMGTNFSAIPNSALTNSSVTVGTTAIALGASNTTIAGLTSLTTATAVAPILTMTNGGLTTVTYTSASTTTGQIIDTVLIASIRTIKYLVQVTSGTSYQACEIMIIHDGTTPSITEYADVNTGTVLATFDASIVTGSLNLIFTPTNAVTTVRLVRTTLNL